jgi:hypothetical protein
MEYLPTQPAEFYKVSFDFFKRYPLLLAARLRNQSLPKILQNGAVFFQIDSLLSKTENSLNWAKKEAPL